MKYYFVKPGDTLNSIASLYDTELEEIKRLNDIGNPDQVSPGQGILIPKLAKLYPFSQKEMKKEKEAEAVLTEEILQESTQTQTQEPAQEQVQPYALSTESKPAATKRYEVQAGDTLFKIAEMFNTTVGVLVRVNNITDPDLIYPGREILLPESNNPTESELGNQQSQQN